MSLGTIDLTMRPAELAAMLANTIANRLPVLIKGAPGIGKTDIVCDAAATAEAELIVLHPVISDPTDFKGLPAVVGGKAAFLPFGDLEAMCNAKRLTAVFFDDIGQAPQMVQAALMQLILKREINGKRVSPKVVFVAATNRREDRAGVTGILEPVKSRFATIVELKADLNDWCTWALANGVPPVVVAFNRFRPDLFANPGTPTNDIVNRPSPRTIANMGRLYGCGLTTLPVLAGAVGVGYATEFVGFERVWRSLPDIDAILVNPKAAPVPAEPSACFAVAVALAARCSAVNAGRVVAYLARLPEEYAALGIRDIQRTCPTATNNPEFIRWAVAHQNLLS
jgi:hypothetical protein